VERFHTRLHTQIAQARRQLSDELTVIEALVRMGELESAVHALEDQRMTLRALRAQLERTVTDTVGQPAERTDNARRRCRAQVSSAAAAIGRLGYSRVAVILVAALLGLGIAASSVRYQTVNAFGPRTVAQERDAWTAFHTARQRMAAQRPRQTNALAMTTETRALHDQILALPDDTLADERVRDEIQQLLVEQSGALLQLQDSPEATSLLAEVRALAASLGLEPGILAQPPLSPPLTLPSELPLPLEQADQPDLAESPTSVVSAGSPTDGSVPAQNPRRCPNTC
jgi:hypothetical protein